MFCRYIVGNVYLCKFCYVHSWSHRWRQQVTKYVKVWNCYISINISARASIKISEMLMAILLVNSTSCITSGKKRLSRPQNGGHFDNVKILNTASISPQIWKDCPKLCHKRVFFMVMTSSMTPQGSLKVSPLYSLINEIRTFFMITKKQTKISSLNFLYLGFMGIWLYAYKSIFMTLLMTK